MSQNTLQLVLEARRMVALYNHDFARLTGVSLRTVERNASTGGIGYATQTHKLIAAVHPKNAELARQLAASSGTTLEALGLAKPAAALPSPPVAAAAPLPPPKIPDARPEHADSVLLAAANALDLPPRAVRPAVAAAFAKAKELGVSLAGLAEQLAREEPSASAKREHPLKDGPK